MADRRKIEWTDASYTPIRAKHRATGRVGWHCTHATPGCVHCYAEGMNKRLGTGLPFKPGHAGEIELFLDEEMLLAPLRWKKPRMIFVCSMTDLFADFVPDEWIDLVFAVMALTPQHTYQVLTKRSARMRVYLADKIRAGRVARAVLDLVIAGTAPKRAINDETWPVESIGDDIDLPDDVTLRNWPLPNVWLGVSAEDQRRADERIPDLLATPAAIRFVSAEPLLGPIDFNRIHEEWTDPHSGCHTQLWESALNGKRFDIWSDGDTDGHPKLDWIIVGGESGPQARPMHPDWARQIRDQCAVAGTAFFFKQWGQWAPICEMSEEQVTACYRSNRTARDGQDQDMLDDVYGRTQVRASSIMHADGTLHEARAPTAFAAGKGAMTIFSVGKKAAGRLLGGVAHDGMPEVRR